LSDIAIDLEDSDFLINLEKYQMHHFLLSIYTFILLNRELNMFYGVLLTKIPSDYQKVIIKILYERSCLENNKSDSFEQYFKQFCGTADTMPYDYYIKNSLRIPIDNICTELCKILCDKSYKESMAVFAAVEFILCIVNVRLNDYAKCKLGTKNKIILDTNNQVAFDLLLLLEDDSNKTNIFMSILNTVTLFKSLFVCISQIFNE